VNDLQQYRPTPLLYSPAPLTSARRPRTSRRRPKRRFRRRRDMIQSARRAPQLPPISRL
jgi:hypothetical protein